MRPVRVIVRQRREIVSVILFGLSGFQIVRPQDGQLVERLLEVQRERRSRAVVLDLGFRPSVPHPRRLDFQHALFAVSYHN